MEQYEYLNGPPAPRMVAELAMRHDALVRQLADAQATIAALQARVQVLEAEVDTLTQQEESWESQLTQRTAECDALKLVNDTHMKTVMKLSHVVEQRTAERDTARRRVDELEAREVDVVLLREDLEKRTAELEAAQHDAEVYRKMHAVASMERNILSNERADLQAELERVRLLSSHNERRFELLEEKYKELRTLILTLPKVEGEIVAQAGYVKDRKKVYACFGSDADMTAYAALLTHRQGMEG